MMVDPTPPRLMQAVDQYRDGFEPNDDLTLLYLRMALPCR